MYFAGVRLEELKSESGDCRSGEILDVEPDLQEVASPRDNSSRRNRQQLVSSQLLRLRVLARAENWAILSGTTFLLMLAAPQEPGDCGGCRFLLWERLRFLLFVMLLLFRLSGFPLILTEQEKGVIQFVGNFNRFLCCFAGHRLFESSELFCAFQVAANCDQLQQRGRAVLNFSEPTLLEEWQPQLKKRLEKSEFVIAVALQIEKKRSLKAAELDPLRKVVNYRLKNLPEGLCPRT
jgi:hypothetical protein